MHTQALDIDTLTAADIRAAATTDDPAIYEDADGLYVLVGTDGMGTDESRWAVRPE